MGNKLHHDKVSFLIFLWPPLLIHPFLHYFRCLGQVGLGHIGLLMPPLGKLVCSGALACILSSSSGRHQRLLAHSKLKRASVGCLAPLKIIGELGHVKQFKPISLIGTHIVPQIKLQQGIHPLDLAIGLWVKACKEIKLRAKKIEKLGPKVPRNARVPVTNNDFWNSLILHHMG